MTSVVAFACARIRLLVVVTVNSKSCLRKNWHQMRSVSNYTTACLEVGLLLLELLGLVRNVLSVKHFVVNVLVQQYFLTVTIPHVFVFCWLFLIDVLS